MRYQWIWVSLLATLTFALTARAAENDVAAGEELYGTQCMVCHGLVVWSQTGPAVPASSPRHLAALDTQQMGARPTHDTAQGIQIAVAPPYGPNLGGILGRMAGTAQGFNYSKQFLTALTGMAWTEAALDVWITDTQRWVPGVTMYFKQPNAEIRRKIILYLKSKP
jgi:cytochrome c2